MADAMMSGFPRNKSMRLRLEHVWKHYLRWGVANPASHRALTQIEVWTGLTEESKTAGLAPFQEVQAMAEAARRQRIIRDLPHEFIVAVMNSLAEATMKFMRAHPNQAQTYLDSGFEVLWAAIACKK